MIGIDPPNLIVVIHRGETMKSVLITLPGKNYHRDKPLFYYLEGLTHDENMALYHLSYPKHTFDVEDFPEIILHLKSEIQGILSDNAPQQEGLAKVEVLIVAKSIGTVLLKWLAPWILKTYPGVALKQILITPITQALCETCFDIPTLAIYGSCDDLLDKPSRALFQLNAQVCVEISGANHSLTIGHLEQDLNALVKVYGAMTAFIRKDLNDTLTFKPAKGKDDWQILVEALMSAHPLYEPYMGDAFVKLAARYRENGPSEPDNYHLIYYNQTPIGFCAFESVTEDTVYLIGLYLLSEFKGRGLGARTLCQLEHYWSFMGFKQVLLQAHEAAHWAIDFYTKLHYQRIKTPESLRSIKVLNKTHVMGKSL